MGGAGVNAGATSAVLIPPDGGWGWVVVFSSFMIHIFTDGVTYCFGIFINQFLEYFQESAAATSWIASIMVGVTLCSGPLSSALVNKYGCRSVTIGGAILASVSLFASAWAPNIATLYVTAGLFTGLGFGLIYLPAIVSVTCYFEKLRSLATGIAVCGSGVGTFLLAPLFQWLVQEYGWRGAMLIVSALMLHCIIFGILFRPLEPTEIKEVELQEVTQKSEENTKQNGGRPHSVHGHEILFQQPVRNQGMNGDLARMALSQPALDTVKRERSGSHVGVMSRKDVLFSGSLAHIKTEYRSTQWIPVDTKSDKPKHGAPDEASIASDTTVVCGFIPCSRETADGFREMVDFSLLKDPIFILYTISNFFTSIGFNVPYVHLVTFVDGKDIGVEGSLMISIIGISNTVGRIILGYIADKPWVNRLYIYNWSLTIAGIATALCSLCDGFWAFAIYSAVYGFSIGAYVGLTSVILVDLLGLDKLTNAFGILLLFQGVASLLGPPLVGWLYDITLSYTFGFIVAGIVMAVSGLMLFIVPWLQRYLAKNQRPSPC